MRVHFTWKHFKYLLDLFYNKMWYFEKEKYIFKSMKRIIGKELHSLIVI